MELQKSFLCPSLVFYSFHLVLGFLLCMHPLHTESVPADQISLLNFKKQIVQDPLGALSSWNSSHHYCDWQGITCGGRRERVIVLNLESKSLVGSLSPHIGNLTSLRILNLQNNSFYGRIPEDIGNLGSLRDLALSNNSFDGNIPANLSRCSNLILLHLSSNKLTGEIPTELGSLSKLVLLGFRMNYLIGRIPSSFGNLSSLQHLTLNFNNLEGSLPDSLGQMPSLKYIRIGRNNLSGTVPSSLWNLSSLIEFYVVENHIQGILPLDIGRTLPNLENFGLAANNFSGHLPGSISNISSLDYFNVAGNNFIGSVPSNLGNLKLLKKFDIGSNFFGSGKQGDLNFFNSLTDCRDLEKLNLNDNNFGGVIPSSIANLSTKLQSLELGGNQIYGSIPRGIEKLVNLSQLLMERNLLTGSIPLSIGKLQKLQRLSLYGNKLSGQIPPSLGKMSALYDLHLGHNTLTGTIPLSLSSLHSLKILDLSRNRLNGSLPGPVIGSSTTLRYINLSYNSFTSLPLEVGNLKNLEALDISENKVSGEIPNALGDCTKLEKLYMKGNTFQGKLSSSLNKLSAIQYLDISGNNLSGPIPKYLENFTFLQNLNLSFNKFQGEVPTKGVFRNISAFFFVGNRKLCGGIPDLQLPLCPTQESNKDGRSISLTAIIVAPIVILVLAMAITSLLQYWKRKPRENMSPQWSLGDSYMRVSYDELLKATRGFSESNLIGVGSFGSVYKGYLHLGETLVAVKVLNLQQRGASKSFIAECEALKEIRHRNLLQVFTCCSYNETERGEFKALVFKFMSNGSLDDWLHPNQPSSLSLSQRLNIAIDVASALDYLHHQGQNPIVHCDLKPSNVLLDDDFTAHVGDFGLAEILSADPNTVQSNESNSVAILKGSIGYVAPEYGMGGKPSTRGDMYSYGILLLEMFTGKRPTAEMFKDNLSLHIFCKLALLNGSVEVFCPEIFKQECVKHLLDQGGMRSLMIECLFPILQIGISCSADSEADRLDIKDAIRELGLIRNVFKGMRIYSEKC